MVRSLIRFAGILLLGLSLSAQTTNDAGVIEGRVVDTNGIPVKAAKIHAELLDGSMAKAIRYVIADDGGAFLIDHLAFGTYRVFGMKEEDDFPDTLWFPSMEVPRVTISAQQLSGTVLVKLGPKAGVITGIVRDQRTGKPVLAGFTVRRLNDSWFLTSSQPPNFRIFVPSSTDVSLEVIAPSYEKWTYADRTSNLRQLRLGPGVHLRLDIKLTPKPDESKLARFLVPEAYKGRLRLECDIKDQPAVPREIAANVFKFSPDGILRTSSPCPSPGPENVYYYYSKDALVREISDNYWNGNGMIWG